MTMIIIYDDGQPNSRERREHRQHMRGKDEEGARGGRNLLSLPKM